METYLSFTVFCYVLMKRNSKVKPHLPIFLIPVEFCVFPMKPTVILSWYVLNHKELRDYFWISHIYLISIKILVAVLFVAVESKVEYK